MDEREKVELLCELFGWPTGDDHARYHALVILRRARGEEPPPSFDDFKVKGCDR